MIPFHIFNLKKNDKYLTFCCYSSHNEIIWKEYWTRWHLFRKRFMVNDREVLACGYKVQDGDVITPLKNMPMKMAVIRWLRAIL